MAKRLLLLNVFFVFAVGANAQTIPKSIDKPVIPKQQQKAVATNAAAAREQGMNKRTGHYIYMKKYPLYQKIISTNGYVDISYRNDRLYIKGVVEYRYTTSTTKLTTEHKYEGPFEWSGKFNKKTQYQGGDTGYLFWNGEDGYLKTEIKNEKGEYVKVYFVEVYEKYVWISCGAGFEDFTFYK